MWRRRHVRHRHRVLAFLILLFAITYIDRVWWSAFTSLTGAVSNYVLLLVVRFLFGAGEAGAFPNASIVVARWFPPAQRASVSGILLMARA